MILCYITDRMQFSGTEQVRRRCLLDKIAEAASCGVHLVQLRERDLTARDLQDLALEAVRIIQNESSRTRLLVNSRLDIAMTVGAHGVHLRSGDISAAEARSVWAASDRPATPQMPLISVSCHTPEEVQHAAAYGADFAVFAPVIEKLGKPGVGLKALRLACRARLGAENVEGPGTSDLPVLALGGITLQNAAECITAGAAGIAGIRLFQENPISLLMQTLLRTTTNQSGSP